MAINGQLFRQFGSWTEQSIAYRLTDLYQNVPYALRHRRMHRVLIEFARMDPPHLGRLAARRRLAANSPRREHEGAFLSNLAITRVEDHVTRIRIDPDQVGDLAIYSGFLLCLPDTRLGDRFPRVHRAARQRPVLVVGSPHEQ